MQQQRVHQQTNAAGMMQGQQIRPNQQMLTSPQQHMIASPQQQMLTSPGQQPTQQQQMMQRIPHQMASPVATNPGMGQMQDPNNQQQQQMGYQGQMMTQQQGGQMGMASRQQQMNQNFQSPQQQLPGGSDLENLMNSQPGNE